MQMSCDEGTGSEEFFDSAECLSVEESDSFEEYAVWLSEPQSVEQRRKLFLLGMGLDECGSPVSSSSDDCPKINGDSMRVPGIERLSETSKSVSSTSFSESDFAEGDRVCSRNEVESRGNSIISDRDMSADSAMKREKRGNKSSFWRSLLGKINNKRSVIKPRAPWGETHKFPALRRIKAHQYKKRVLELSALYSSQDIQAHDSVIWTMKFSPDGKYLATGGEDGIICIWRVMSADASLEDMYGGPETSLYRNGKSVNQASVLKPNKVFWIDESPVQVFGGHASDILDLAWSSSNMLLSSSKDYTVRLWQLGCDRCQDVFHHSNYVTCVQFNPVDDDCFISGSIDGKARVWRVSTRRVIDWIDVRDAISAICYRPHGKGFAVGTIVGACHLYETTGTQMQRDATVSIRTRRKRNTSNRIIGIQFSKDIPGRVIISSLDSKLLVFEGNDLIYKYKGPRKSGSQMSASFSSNKKYSVSVGEDSRVYLWNQSDYTAHTHGSTKSVPSCEYFSSEGATVAVPWSGNCTAEANTIFRHNYCKKEQERFSLGKWLSQDGKCRTWPEEVLPLWKETPGLDSTARAGVERWVETWGLVFVTGSRDGRIRTFQNYGLPVRRL